MWAHHAGTFLRGVLDKVGVQPELVRIGKFKSAGDQLLRTDMSVCPVTLITKPLARVLPQRRPINIAQGCLEIGWPPGHCLTHLTA